MSNIVVKKNEKPSTLTQVTILILLLSVVVFALLTAYKLLVREPTITPQEAELKQYMDRVKANPRDKDARMLLAFTYQKGRDFANAIKQYNEALKINPKEVAAIYNLGVIAKEQKKYGEAEKYFKKVLKIREHHVLATIGLSEVYIEKGKYDDAINVIDKIINFEGQLTDPRLIKAKALEKKGEKARAIEEYQTVLKYVPDQKEALEALKRLQRP